eukprot:maker-scaffold119_size336447-snap-gene-0.11 protein:Tk11766 transcript:maker-scaffold119_size336447-snap-gene-0.11-mRNA-1 annotation:"hypothetical protein DAPPUDRAFT_309202"
MNRISLALVFSAIVLLSGAHASVKQCEDLPDTPIKFISGDAPDEVSIPGSFQMSLVTEVTSDMPEDLYMGLQLLRVDPPLEVPCVEGLGSCPYDLCKIISNFSEETCNLLPEGQTCGCPLLTNTFDLQGLTVNVPDFGALTPLMIGSYTARANLYSLADPVVKLGCIEFDFTFTQE